MIFRNYQKTFAIIGIVAIMIPAFFLAMPRKANATVPVIDAAAIAVLEMMEVELAAIEVSTDIIATETTSLVTKEYTLDLIAYTVAGVALRAVTDSIVEWINNGFEGNPGFITDFDQYLQDALDQATGKFFKEFLSTEMQSLICSPFRAQLNLGLKTKNSFQQIVNNPCL